MRSSRPQSLDQAAGASEEEEEEEEEEEGGWCWWWTGWMRTVGVITGPGAHSIAGLLPAEPPGGMRVVVAGRPNPPIPDDVPDWHPLRDPGIIRPLADSPYARDVQRLGRQELQRPLHGSRVEQDLLGSRCTFPLTWSWARWSPSNPGCGLWLAQ